MPARLRQRSVLVVLGLLLAVVAVTAVVLRPADDGPAVRETPGEVAGTPEDGGEPVPLDVSVFTPAPGAPGADEDGRRAAVMLAHGFGGSKDDLAGQARRLAAEGYVVLTWTARGFGESGGLIHLSARDYEIADVSRLVDALAARDDVRLDAEGDPVVGIAGASYGGAAALLGAAYDDRVDAAVPAMTWHDLEQSLVPQSAAPVPYGPTGTGVFKQSWAALLYGAGLAASVASPPAGTEPGEQGRQLLCGRFAPQVCGLYQRLASGGRVTDDDRALLAASSATPAALRDYRAPTLLVQGEQDSLFGLDQAQRTATELRDEGVDVRLRWAEGGHDAAGLTGEDDVVTQALPFLDEQLRDGPAVDPADDVELTLPPPPLRDDDTEARVTDLGELLDPPTVELELSGGVQPVVSPPGGQPAALTSLPGGAGGLGGGQAAGVADALGQAYALAALPGATAVFETDPLTEPMVVAGAPEVALTVTTTAADATLFASLWVVGEDDTATLPRRLVSPVAVSGDDVVEVRLPTSAYRVEAGQRLRLVVASTDQAYAVPADGRLYTVGLGLEGQLRLPVPPTEALASGEPLVATPLLVGVGLLLLVALAGAFAAAGRARGREAGDPDPELADTPLVVDGLVKEYGNGFRAVDGVSWRAERGQVVGLLGPNGAGKTTTMRMLVGLIGADEGAVQVLGRPVAAGSPVLARVGTLIEGPGFLPHLTGRENLEAYWAATGRPREEAGFDEALAVADLGVAVDRQARSYSHGMKQRLGIAQAMLGRPEVLLLDEPTNGLDPPQIRGLRDVLRSYAEGGRTVVVSSHLLSEVEQTCSHVVVMHRGRVVLSGAVDELVASGGDVVVTLDGTDPAAAARLLGSLSGVTSAEVVGASTVRVSGSASRSRLVEVLVRDGHRVAGLDARRPLEEVFMGLVGDGEPAQVAGGAGEER